MLLAGAICCALAHDGPHTAGRQPRAQRQDAAGARRHLLAHAGHLRATDPSAPARDAGRVLLLSAGAHTTRLKQVKRLVKQLFANTRSTAMTRAASDCACSNSRRSGGDPGGICQRSSTAWASSSRCSTSRGRSSRCAAGQTHANSYFIRSIGAHPQHRPLISSTMHSNVIVFRFMQAHGTVLAAGWAGAAGGHRGGSGTEAGCAAAGRAHQRTGPRVLAPD